jgi:5-enolpyruvylshikimate-3-phosphate synthase
LERTVNRARKITGQVRVPGELPTALRAVWLAAISIGDSRIEHAPPSLLPHLEQLKSLGVGVGENEEGLVITGVGLRGFTATSESVDLRGLGVEALLPVTVLAMQPTSRTIHIDASLAETIQALFALLAQTGAVGGLPSESQVQVDGVEAAAAVDHSPADLDADTKLALLCAGLYAEAGSVTTVRQAATSKDRVDDLLTERGISIAPNRRGDPALRAMLLTAADPTACDVDLPGDLDQALPFIVAALIVGRSELTVARVAIRTQNRTFLDLLRQIKGEVEIIDQAGFADLVVKSSRLKGTRVADKRATRLIEHIPLLAVLATQTEGEFIIRDVEALRRCEDVDLIAHLVTLLRELGAKVGEYPEGFVIDGARPLKGTDVVTHARPQMAQAFAVAGLVSKGDMQIHDSDSVDAVFPGFFDTLDSITVKERQG